MSAITPNYCSGKDSLLLPLQQDTFFCLNNFRSFLQFKMATALEGRIGQDFNYFVALEVKCDSDHRDFISQIEELQVRTVGMFPVQDAKLAKIQSLHITLATLQVHEDELAFVIQSLADAVNQFKRIYSGEDGIRADFQGGSTSRDVAYLQMGLGANAFNTFKQTLMVNGLHRFVTDLCQSPHLTFVRNLDLTEAETGAMIDMMKDIKTTRITLDTVSLRERKRAGEQLKPPIRQYVLWRE